MSKYCSHCGKPLDPGSMFCNHCGAPASISRDGSSNTHPQRLTEPAPNSAYGFSRPSRVATDDVAPQQTSNSSKTTIMAIVIGALVVIIVFAITYILLSNNNSKSSPTAVHEGTEIVADSPEVEITQPVSQPVNSRDGRINAMVDILNKQPGSRYTLYDITRDGIPDLFLNTNGHTEVWDVASGSPRKLGQVPDGEIAYGRNYLITVTYTNDYVYWTHITGKGGELQLREDYRAALEDDKGALGPWLEWYDMSDTSAIHLKMK